METTRLDRQKLLGIVKENRTKHVADYNEAVAGWRVTMAEKLTEFSDRMKEKIGDVDRVIGGFNSGETPEEWQEKVVLDRVPLPPQPASYEKDYDRAIRKLELSVDDTIELDDEQFRQLVLDEWDWKQAFVTSNALYAGKSAPLGR